MFTLCYVNLGLLDTDSTGCRYYSTWSCRLLVDYFVLIYSEVTELNVFTYYIVFTDLSIECRTCFDVVRGRLDVRGLSLPDPFLLDLGNNTLSGHSNDNGISLHLPTSLKVLNPLKKKNRISDMINIYRLS